MQVIAHGIYRFRELPVTSPTIARALLAIAASFSWLVCYKDGVKL